MTAIINAELVMRNHLIPEAVLFMEDGKICGVGRHNELLERCDVYREIHESQFKGGDEV